MHREELIKITAASTECPPEHVEKIIDAYLNTIICMLQTQERVDLRTDFGSFVVRIKGGELSGRSFTKTQRVVSFKATSTLKKVLRQDDQSFLDTLREKGAHIQIKRLCESQPVSSKSGG